MIKQCISLLFFCLLFSTQSTYSEQIPAHQSKAPAAPFKSLSSSEENEHIAFFTPPSDWHLAETDKLAKSVKVMVIGKAKSSFPPSMNLATQPYAHSLKKYLSLVKDKNKAEGYEWKDLGTIKTKAGVASLSQVDTRTEWGTVRLMHVILLKKGHIYILTASALANEFAFYYKDFFDAMKSLTVYQTLYEILPQNERNIFKQDVAKLHTQWLEKLRQKREQDPSSNLETLKDQIFNNPDFQKSIWIPFKELVDMKFAPQGAQWPSIVLQKIESDLYQTNL